MKSSQEHYEEYQKAKLREERLIRANHGINLLSTKEERNKNRKWTITIKIEGSINLLRDKRIVHTSTSLPINLSYWGADDKEFLKLLEVFVNRPRFTNTFSVNKKDTVSSWSDDTKFRTEHINFCDVEFDIGFQAEQKTVGFRDKVKELLLKQRECSTEEKKDFMRYQVLNERVKDLERQHKDKGSYSYYYSSRPNTDTIKMLINHEEYNKKLLLVEEEVVLLVEKHDSLKKIDFDYYKEKEEEDDPYYNEEEEDDDGFS